MTTWFLFPHFSPLKTADRRCLHLIVGSPNQIMGAGTSEHPWQVIHRHGATDAPPAAVLQIDDVEPDYFEQLPPPPTDLIVVLSRLNNQRSIPALGVGYPLQWEEPNSLALEALREIMDQTPGLVLGFPLSQSQTPEVVATPFQRASIPLDRVRGRSSQLPSVHRIALTDPELGGHKTRAGFTQLEDQPADPERAFLLARWSDRVVFSLPLAVEIARRNLDLSELEIILGHEIRLGPEGPAIPIDSQGRTTLPPADSIPDPDLHSAYRIIAETLPEPWPDSHRALFLTDHRLLAPKASRRWAERLPAIHHAIRRAPNISARTTLSRPPAWIEITALIILSILITTAVTRWKTPGRVIASTLGLIAIALALAFVARSFSFAPLTLAFLAVPTTALILSPWVAVSPPSFFGKDRTYRRNRDPKLPKNRPRE